MAYGWHDQIRPASQVRSLQIGLGHPPTRSGQGSTKSGQRRYIWPMTAKFGCAKKKIFFLPRSDLAATTKSRYYLSGLAHVRYACHGLDLAISLPDLTKGRQGPASGSLIWPATARFGCAFKKNFFCLPRLDWIWSLPTRFYHAFKKKFFAGPDLAAPLNKNNWLAARFQSLPATRAWLLSTSTTAKPNRPGVGKTLSSKKRGLGGVVFYFLSNLSCPYD